MEFQPGDQVVLKSGGPAMTVERIGKNQETQEDVILCVWFHDEGKRRILNRVEFSPVTLRKYDPASGFAAFSVVRM